MSNYPDLSKESVICFDIETYDPNLKEKGNGVYRKDGYILGCAVHAQPSGFVEYINLGHKGITQTQANKNKAYLRDIMTTHVPKLGTGILYDMDWLQNILGVKINGRLHDIQVAEALLDENRRAYDLDTLAKEYLGKTKINEYLKQLCESKGLHGDVRTHLWQLPYDIVKPYALGDVTLPIDIFRLQRTKLKEQDLWELYLLEMELFPLLLQMRKQGVRIDVDKLAKHTQTISEDLDATKQKLHARYGHFNINSGQQIAEVLDAAGVAYPLTKNGNPNIDKNTLPKIKHPMTVDILKIRNMKNILNTFFINSFGGMEVNGRLHCNFHPLKKDNVGTISGRFSASHPNLQNIPASGIYGQMAREIFLPEEGMLWSKIDYSQIEYLFIAHYARGPKSDEIRHKYNTNPLTDYHALVMEWMGTDRRTAKRLNFGAAYAMGIKTCAVLNGWTMDESRALLAKYHVTMPFVKFTREKVEDKAKTRGYIRTILNRRARVTDSMRASRKFYSMFNRLMQGSAADMLKKAMIDGYKAGIFEVLKLHLIVHDEFDQSVPKTKTGKEACLELKNIMENAIKLKVPIKADLEIGTSWGQLTNYNEENWRKYVGA